MPITFTGYGDPNPVDFTPDNGTSDLGVDLSALPDLDSRFPLLSGFANLGEALARRLQTQRGSLFYDTDYGIDLRQYLNTGLTDDQVFLLQASVESEVEKDPRILSASATATLDTQAQTLSINIIAQTADGPFTLVLSVSQLTVDVLDLKA